MSKSAADTYREELSRMSNVDLAAGGFALSLRYWPLAALCLLLVWLLERSFGRMVFGFLGTNAYDVLASVLVMTLFLCITGTAFSVVVVCISRLVVAGRLPVFGSTPAKMIHPAWWLRWLFQWMVLMVVCHALFAAWRYGYTLQGVPETVADREASVSFSWFIAVFLFFSTGCTVLIDNLAPRLGNFQKWAKSSRVVWGSWSVLSFVWMTAACCMTFIGACLLAQPTFIAFGLGSPLNPIAVGAGVLLALGFGWWSGRDTWAERSLPSSPVPDVPPCRDFWNWDIDAETSAAGVAENGYPFFLWRESADNRLGLSRPRYVCILKEQGELNLAFFNPSQPVRPTGGFIIGGGVALLVALAMISGFWASPSPPAPYVSNMNPPPFLWFLSIVMAAGLSGAASGSLCYACVTLIRWYWDRFAQDGGLWVRPLQTLSGFNLVDAGEVGAMANGEKAKTGHGLTAVFEDGTMWILTANAWEYPTMVLYHSALTNAFREPRDRYLVDYEAEKREMERSTARAQAPEATIPLGL